MNEPKSTGVELIHFERLRQLSEEGYTTEHDDSHKNYELSCAAMAYVNTVVNPRKSKIGLWPWQDVDWKPSNDSVRNLTKAGALIAAEIDRILRLRKTF